MTVISLMLGHHDGKHMCGIAGLILKKGKDPSFDPIQVSQTMARSLIHRGPDAEGSWHDADAGVFLVHRRLSIIDLSESGRQPLFNENRTLVGLVNGEIYNYPSLREILISKGHRFSSHSDSETILHLFEEDGQKSLQELRGMYAVALYDMTNRTLHLHRDPLGIKPLYLYEDERLIAFASEIRALKVIPGFSDETDTEAWMEFLMMGSVSAPLTHYKKVRQLRPGEMICIRQEGVSESTGDSPIPGWCRDALFPGDDSPDSMRSCIRDSVQKHLISDVPIGVFLSGGIDSGTLAGLASEVSSGKIHTVSVSIPGDELDESRYARLTAERYGTRHQEVPLDQKQFETDFEVFFDHLDLPSIDGFNTFIVSRAAKRSGLTVALSGVGGDELFGGYNSFQIVPRLLNAHRAASRMGSISRWMVAFAIRRLKGGSPAARASDFIREHPVDLRFAYMTCRGLFTGSLLHNLVRPDLKHEINHARTRYLEQTEWTLDSNLSTSLAIGGLELTRYMTSQLLRDTDVMSMAHSLEVRVPIVDREVIRHGLRHLARMPEGDGYPKWMLRHALQQPLPDEVVQRAKQGFVFPWQNWLKGIVTSDFDRLLAKGGRWEEIFVPDQVRWWKDAYQRGWAHWSCFWAIYICMKMLGEASSKKS